MELVPPPAPGGKRLAGAIGTSANKKPETTRARGSDETIGRAAGFRRITTFISVVFSFVSSDEGV